MADVPLNTMSSKVVSDDVAHDLVAAFDRSTAALLTVAAEIAMASGATMSSTATSDIAREAVVQLFDKILETLPAKN
jgi:hypothetical protein